MARWWIGLLLLLNVALLAWNMGALTPWGWGPEPAQSGPVVTLPIQGPAAEAASAPVAPASSAANASAGAASPAKPAASAPRPKPVATPLAPASAPDSN